MTIEDLKKWTGSYYLNTWKISALTSLYKYLILKWNRLYNERIKFLSSEIQPLRNLNMNIYIKHQRSEEELKLIIRLLFISSKVEKEKKKQLDSVLD